MQLKKDIKPHNYVYIKAQASLWKIILRGEILA